MRRIVVVYGTRPEAVKVAPIVREMRTSARLRPIVVVTGQHREMLDQVNRVFEIEPDYDLDIFAPGQSLVDVTTRSLTGVSELLRVLRPDAVLVQGDTATAFTGSLAAFHEKIPVVHVEAGLRTQNRYLPYPEEIYRRLTTQLTTLHLASTHVNRANLLADGIKSADIAVTGNTVIDALFNVVAQRRPYDNPEIADLVVSGRRIVLVTSHRRESWGGPMRAAMRAIGRVARAHPEVAIIFPMHCNPVVRDVVKAALAGLTNVLLTEPLHYAEFVRLLSDSAVVVTDSGGLQEEAPSLGKPVLLLRDFTERPEAVEAGVVRPVGTDEHAVEGALTELLEDPVVYGRMARPVNSYGDGNAAVRCVAALTAMFGEGSRLPDFG